MKIKLNNSSNINDLFEEFITHCTVKNLASKTIDNYKECFKLFLLFYNDTIINITKKTIDNYILYLKKKGTLNDISINTNLRNLRVIIYYFQGCEYIPKFKIEMLKVEKKIKETYTDNELKLLLKKPNLKKCEFSEYRNWVMINYLLATGNRSSTLLNLKIKDVDLNNNLITLTKTKNKRQQIIPLSNSISNILKEYLAHRKGTQEDYLFPTSHNNKITSDSIITIIKRYNERRGVYKTSIHLFRHTFAKLWILNGGDIFRLQKILGHSSLDIVKEYVNMFGNDLQNDFNKFNPLESFNKNSYIKLE